MIRISLSRNFCETIQSGNERTLLNSLFTRRRCGQRDGDSNALLFQRRIDNFSCMTASPLVNTCGLLTLRQQQQAADDIVNYSAVGLKFAKSLP